MKLKERTDQDLLGCFEEYLIHGGYLRALNDMAAEGRVRPTTLATYCDWVRGDFLKRGRQERYLREILGAVVKRLASQVTWNGLSKDLSIDHPMTVADYVKMLARMDVLVVQHALREDRLGPAPKKARKVFFVDPFILHAMRSWLSPARDPMAEQIVPYLQDPEATGRLVEGCAVSHFGRFYPTFYIKAEGEVDIAYLAEGRFHPVEVKWTTQIRSSDLKQLKKYPDGLILSRERGPQSHGVANRFLPEALYELAASPH